MGLMQLMPGTANEQAAGLGIPVVGFATAGPQYVAGFAARQQRLLGAALTVFVSKGYHAAAMEDIADEAGVSKPVLYQHFPGKLELYLALLDNQCDHLEGLVLEALNSSDDHEERVYATVLAFFEFVADEGGAFRLIYESDLTNEPQVRHRIDALEAQLGG